MVMGASSARFYTFKLKDVDITGAIFFISHVNILQVIWGLRPKSVFGVITLLAVIKYNLYEIKRPYLVNNVDLITDYRKFFPLAVLFTWQCNFFTCIFSLALFSIALF